MSDPHDTFDDIRARDAAFETDDDARAVVSLHGEDARDAVLDRRWLVGERAILLLCLDQLRAQLVQRTEALQAASAVLRSIPLETQKSEIQWAIQGALASNRDALADLPDVPGKPDEPVLHWCEPLGPCECAGSLVFPAKEQP